MVWSLVGSWAVACLPNVSRLHIRSANIGRMEFEMEMLMPRGASHKREHEYQELKTEFKKEGRYPGREEEVASRIVNKQRAEHGETKKSSKKEKAKS